MTNIFASATPILAPADPNSTHSDPTNTQPASSIAQPAPSPEAATPSSPVAEPATPPKKAKTRRRSVITSNIWEELRALYEGGNYSQRHLMDYAAAKGIRISQSAISRRAMQEGWVKNSKIEELRAELQNRAKEIFGETIAKMLGQHASGARMIAAEVFLHFKVAAENRKLPGGASYVIPPSQLSLLTETLNKAQQMEARALGFDFRTGKTVREANAEDSQPEVAELKVRVYTPQEEEEIQRRVEAGDDEDE